MANNLHVQDNDNSVLIMNGNTDAIGPFIAGSRGHLNFSVYSNGTNTLGTVTVSDPQLVLAVPSPSGQTVVNGSPVVLGFSTVFSITPGNYTVDVTIPSDDVGSPFVFHIAFTLNAPTVNAILGNNGGSGLD